MADEKKKTEKKDQPSTKPAAKAAGETPVKKPAAKKPAGQTASKAKAPAKKPAEKKAPAKSAERKAPAKKPAEKKAPAKPRAEKTEAKPKTEPKPKAEAKKEPQRPVVNARARFVRVAPRKARLVADQVRGLPIEDARALLRFSSRGAARDIRKLIDSAAANAEANHDLIADDLLIKDIHVDEGPTLRRYRPRALGRATRINKRTSHIAVALTPED
jgi:ribosomal protein L22